MKSRRNGGAGANLKECVVNDSNRRPERKVEDPQAFVAQIKAKAAADREQRLKLEQKQKAEHPPIELLKRLVNPANPYPNKPLLRSVPAEAEQTKSDKSKSNKSPSKVRAFSNKRNPSGHVSSFDNAITAIDKLGLQCRYDVFHDRMLVSGHPLQIGTDENLDSIALMVRRLIVDRFDFDPGHGNVFDAIKSRCLDHMFDPVVDYLASLQWDRVLRIDTWLTTYLGTEDDQLNRAIGRKTLIAGVRRARHPGCKFDNIPVMDNSKQGKGKSTVIAILAGQENFSDQDLLGLNNQEQQEQLQGVWFYELADLSGLHKTDVNKVKSMASRQFDRARPAYGRSRVDRPRRCILIGTTNDPQYLQDPTGNRRFWPFTPGDINIDAVRRDRDQLWAEAAIAEATGESLIIPENLWSDIEDRQSSRMIGDPWQDILVNVEAGADNNGNIIQTTNDDGKPEYRAKSSFLLTTKLGIALERLNSNHSRRLGNAMRNLGWSGPKNLRFGEEQAKGYFKTVPPATNP
jgi:Virulence-associated protein E